RIRRHTKSYGDLSSDVCSSDLHVGAAVHRIERALFQQGGQSRATAGVCTECRQDMGSRFRKSLISLTPVFFSQATNQGVVGSNRSDECCVGYDGCSDVLILCEV